MNTHDFLPLGSIVELKNAKKKLLIVGRGISAEHEGKTLFFDYCGALYPEGVNGEEMAYFNRSSIENVVFTGYDDDQNKIMCDLLDQYVDAHPELQRYQNARTSLWS